MHKILVVDDDNLMLSVMVKALSSAGHDVKAAKSGKDGLDLFHNDDFDLVITDFHMGPLSGLDVAKNIRNSNNKNIPIICVTGDNRIKQNDYFNLVINKPISILDFLNSIQQITKKAA